VNTEYLLGVGKAGGRVRLLLDIEKVITASDVINMKKAAAGENNENST
jgi:purine-binding chemotaxis protein CheW